MTTKLVKVNLPVQLHQQLKMLAIAKNQTQEQILLEILSKALPEQLAAAIPGIAKAKFPFKA